MTDALKLAVVGHTNVGKTSLLRTLARRPDFGTVADAPATTRRAEALTVFDGGAAGTVTLIDTPGLERASELLDALEQASSDDRHDRLAALTRLLDTPAHARAFEQEAGLPPVPIVAVTAGILRDERAACLASGMNDFLPKPFRRANLVDILQRWRPGAAGMAGKRNLS